MRAGVYRLHPAASEDLKRLADYLLAHGGPKTSVRFVDAARETLRRLAAAPGLGSPLHSTKIALLGMRKSQVERFPPVLVFYVGGAEGITVVRILHAASDWQVLLDAD